MSMEWLKDPAKWNARPVANRLEVLRKHYCTGPCGASVSVGATRDATSRAIKEAIAELERLSTDARRYQWIRDEHIRCSSPKMNGQHHWRFDCNIRATGNDPGEAIDSEMSGNTITPPFS